MTTNDACPPALRPIDVSPHQAAPDEVYLILNDRLGISPGPLALSPAAYFLAAHCDGRRTIAEIEGAFEAQFGTAPPPGQTAALIAALDEQCFLLSKRFEHEYAVRRDQYLAAPRRDNRARWPAADTLRREIAELLRSADALSDEAPGDAGLDATKRVRGIVAPHLDYARGAPCYAAAYAALAADRPAERYVILGTNHFGRSPTVVATRKAFETPLGVVAADVDFIAAVEQRLGAPLCAHEFDHANEHSVELQVHMLQVLHDGSPFEIVPVLCPDPTQSTGTQPADHPIALDDFADVLAEIVRGSDRRTVLIAGADLSHVGQQFGDDQPTTPEFLGRVRRSDRALLDLLEIGAVEAFVDAVRQSSNATRICSVGCLSALRRALADARCRVVRYHQAIDPPNETHVTCAAAILD
ncbi:MAG: AmmeMemoRadiSam system protein B [Phycisphaerae bacterium]